MSQTFLQTFTQLVYESVRNNVFTKSTKLCFKNNISLTKNSFFRSQFFQTKPSSIVNPIFKFSTRDSLGKSCYQFIKYFYTLNEKLISFIFLRHFNAITALRIRRAGQIADLYKNIGYDKQLVRKFLERFAKSFLNKYSNKSLSFLLGAVLFKWDQEKITEEELKKVAQEMDRLNCKNDDVSKVKESNSENLTGLQTWEKVIDKSHVSVWRKPIPDSYLFEYKVCGTYNDISAKSFFTTQTDLDFRKLWDKLVINLEVIDKDAESGSEIVHWVTHFPYPMYSRDYVYIRRHQIDLKNKLMVIVNRSIKYPSLPPTNLHVRVETYSSTMVIKPHNSFDEGGFDYVLTYHDDPKAPFPSFAYNWLANTGVPDFVDKIHSAAVQLEQDNKKASKKTIDLSGEPKEVSNVILLQPSQQSIPKDNVDDENIMPM